MLLALLATLVFENFTAGLDTRLKHFQTVNYDSLSLLIRL